MSFFELNLKEPFALILSHVEVSKGKAAQILTQPQHFGHHEVCGCMLRRAQHERNSFSVTPGLGRILKPAWTH